MRPVVVSIVGRSGSGKTTFLVALLRVLKARGYRVGTVKHHVHSGISLDREGKDSWEHAQAGADEVIVAAPDQIVTFRALSNELPLAKVVELFNHMDIVLTDGYRIEGENRIEILREAAGFSLVCREDELFAIATDKPLELDWPVPILDIDDFEGAADLIESKLVVRSSTNSRADLNQPGSRMLG